jgi:formate transporter
MPDSNSTRCYRGRSTADKVLAIVPPIAAFVAAGFEHSVANAYFIPVGLFIKAGAPESFWSEIGKTPESYLGLTWENFLVNNLVPVTLGNVIGGAVLVGAMYWFVYLRGAKGNAVSTAVANATQKEPAGQAEVNSAPAASR